MFVLKEKENSDARCDCNVEFFDTMTQAQAAMQEAYQKTIDSYGGTFDSEESELKYAEEQRWANIGDSAAHVQAGIDSVDWEILEDSDWVRAKPANGFVVTGTKTEEESGDLLLIPPVFAATEEEAKCILRKMYLELLQEAGLEDNGAHDEDGNIAPGGQFLEDKADVWDYAEYASYSLVNVATLAIHAL